MKLFRYSLFVLLSFVFFQSGFSQAAGRLNNSFSVNSSGGANYELPVKVPPGLQHITPTLSFTYSSQSVNGALGQGFSLKGLSAITRTGAIPAQDGFRGGVNYSATDRFSLDGKRLVNINSVANGYGGDGAIYFTEVQSWARIRANGSCGNGPCSFTVVLKNGMTLEYGATSDGQVFAAGGIYEDGEKTPSVRKWLLNRVEDLNGNYITYSYTQEPTDAQGNVLIQNENTGQTYIQTIAYTGNENLDPQRFVQFYYESRPDTIVQYLGGGIIQTSVRLTSITTEINTPQKKNELVHTYDILYDSLNATGTSRIVQISLSDANGNQLPPQQFDWTDGTNGFQQNTSSFSGSWNNEGWVADFNGDGRTDLLTYHTNGDDLEIDSLYFSQGNGFTKGTRAENVSSSNLVPYVADFNADGLADIIGIGMDTAVVWLCNGSNFDVAIGIGAPPSSTGSGEVWVYDFNGDGRADIFLSYGDAYQMYLSNGETLDPEINVDIAIDPQNLVFGDFNGDGLTDLYTSYNNETDSLFLSNFSQGTGFNAGIPVSNVNFTETVWVSDFNRDGLADLMILYGNSGYLSFSNGSGFADALELDEVDLGNSGNWIGDYNGDGLTDIFVNGSGSTPSKLYLYRPGMGFENVASLDWQNMSSSNVWVGDFNGDGTTDLFSAQTTPLMLLSADTNVSAVGQNHLTDLLCGIENGMGAKITVSYAPITDTMIYRGSGDKTAPQFLQGTQSLNRYHATPISNSYTSIYPIQPVQSAMYVVDEYTVYNSTQDAARYAYRYEGARLDMRGYGWLGYRKMAKVDPVSQNITVEEFHQLFPLTGSIHTTTSYTLQGQLMVKEQTLYQRKDSIFANGHKIHSVNQIGTREIHYDYGNYAYAIEEGYWYDAYGNVRQKATRDRSDSTAILYTLNSYDNDTIDWQLGYLDASLQSSDSFGNDTLTLVAYTYDQVTRDTLTIRNWIVNDQWLTATYGYDQYGNAIQTINTTGDTATAQYDSYYHTFPTVYTSSPDEQGTPLIIKTFTDPRFGKVDSLYTPNGNLYRIALDGFGRVIADYIPSPDGNSVLFQTTEYVLNPGNGYEKITTQLTEWGGNPTDTTRTYYDALGRDTLTVTSGFDGQSIHSRSVYDMNGMLLNHSYPYYSDSTVVWTNLTYDPYGRLSKIIIPVSETDTAVHKVKYQGQSLTVYETSAGDQVGTQLSYLTRNGQQVYTQIRDENGDSVNFEYDLLGRTRSISNADFTINSSVYDGLSRTISETNISSGTHAYQYNDAQRTVLEISALADSSFTEMDALGRPVFQKFSNGDSLILEYDHSGLTNTMGHLSQVTMSTGQVYTYTYDPLGNKDTSRLIYDGEVYETIASYLPNQNPAQFVFPDGSTEQANYNAWGYLSSLCLIDQSDTLAEMHYEAYQANGTPTEMQYGNGLSLNQIVRFTGDIAGISIGEDSENSVLDLTYYWGEDNEIDSVLRSGSMAEKTNYTYDPVGRLLTATGTNWNESFAYNSFGNQTQKNGLDVTYDHFQPRYVIDGTDTLESRTYDGQGNVTHLQKNTPDGLVQTEYVYNQWNQLAAVLRSGDTLYSYEYDYTGTLFLEVDHQEGIQKLHPFTNYEVVRASSGNEVHKNLSDGVRLIARVETADTTNSVTYYHQDNVGSTVMTSDVNGNVLEEITYYSFGQIRESAVPSASSTHYFFGSKTYHEASELYDFSARHYDANSGHFMSADDQLGGSSWKIDAYNNYAFGLNNPIKNADPTGHNITEDLGVIVVTTAVIGAEVAVGVVSGGTAVPEEAALDLAVAGEVAADDIVADGVVDLASDSEDEVMTDFWDDDFGGDESEREDDSDDEDYTERDPKEPSKRSQYMGGTPQKSSPVGRSVIERMRGEGKIRGNGRSMEFKDSRGVWHPLKDGDMSHKHGRAAVEFWNEVGKYFGERSREVRSFMWKPDNYYIEHKRINRSEGGAMGLKYDSPIRKKRPSKRSLSKFKGCF